MASQNNIVSDVGTLLKIPAKVTSELTDKACLCISSVISEAKRNGEKQVSVHIGLGTLSINLLDMQSKFIPSKDLKTCIKEGLESPRDPLEVALEQSFTDKLLAICDEVI